jgi:small subunit ribosomal protein S4
VVPGLLEPGGGCRMIRKKNLYSRPKKAFEISRIKEENVLLKKYALKKKLEVWKTIAKVDYYRRRAKALARVPLEEQQVLFNKLKALGLKADAIADVLALKVENFLERRLPTIVFKKGFAKTTQEARQMVVHKRILIDDKVVNSPNYLVALAEENLIGLKKKSKPKPKEASKGEVVSKEPQGALRKQEPKTDNLQEKPKVEQTKPEEVKQ